MMLNSDQLFSLGSPKALLCKHLKPAGTKGALKPSHKWLWKENKEKPQKDVKKQRREKRCGAAYGMKRSIMWGGGWDWVGGGAGLEWGTESCAPYCLRFTGTIPECHLLISRLPWQARLMPAGTGSPRLYFPRMLTVIAGAQMMPPSKLPLSGSRVRSTFDPVKYCSWRHEPFQTQQPIKATNNWQTIRHSVRQQHLHTLENHFGRGMSGDPTTHQQGVAKGVRNDWLFWASRSTFFC